MLVDYCYRTNHSKPWCLSTATIYSAQSLWVGDLGWAQAVLLLASVGFGHTPAVGSPLAVVLLQGAGWWRLWQQGSLGRVLLWPGLIHTEAGRFPEKQEIAGSDAQMRLKSLLVLRMLMSH